MDQSGFQMIVDKLLIDEVRVLFPSGILGVFTTESQTSETLFLEEKSLVEQASQKRQVDFCGGRWASHRAMERLGGKAVPIVRHSEYSSHHLQRIPKWPAPWKGTITHSLGIWGAAVTQREGILGLGVDVESWQRSIFLKSSSLGFNEQLAKKITSDKESEELHALPFEKRNKRLAAIFSAKEALYKCLCTLHPLGERLGKDKEALSWKHVTLSFENEVLVTSFKTAAPVLLQNEVLYGRVLFLENYVFTSFWVERASGGKI